MANLTKAHHQLFRRGPDECYESLADLHDYCLRQQEASTDHWEPPARISARPGGDRLQLHIGTDGAFEMTR